MVGVERRRDKPMRDRMTAVEKGYEDLRVLVLRFQRKQIRRLEVIVVLLILGGGGFTYQQHVLREVATTNRALVLKVRESTLVSCTLLANAIQQSGANRSRQTRGPARRGAGQPTAAQSGQSPQSQLNTRLVTKIISLMTPSERHAIMALQREIAQTGGGSVTVPRCTDIVAHPERVRPIGPQMGG